MFTRYNVSEFQDDISIMTVNNIGIHRLKYIFIDNINGITVLKIGYTKNGLTLHIASSYCLLVVNQRLDGKNIGLQLIASRIPSNYIYSRFDELMNDNDWTRYDHLINNEAMLSQNTNTILYYWAIFDYV